MSGGTTNAVGARNRHRTALWRSPELLLSGAAFLWASNFIVGRAIPSSLGPIDLSFWRWTFALPLAYPIAARHLQRDWPAIRSSLPMLMLLAATGLAGSNTFAYLGLRSTTATTALLVQSAIPVAILLFGFLLFRDRPTRRQSIAIAMAMCGVLLVIAGSRSVGGHAGAGTALVAAAMLSQSLYTTLLRRRPAIHPTSFLFTTFSLAALIMLPFELASGFHLPDASGTGLAAITYLAAGPSILAFFLFNRGVELAGASRAAVFFYLMPVFGTLLSFLLLGERILPIQLGGFACVGMGFLLSNRRKTNN